MIDHVWSILCWRSSVDTSRNAISLLEVVEEIIIKAIQHKSSPNHEEVGLLPIELQFVTLWIRGKKDSPCLGKGQVQLISPSGEVIAQSEYDIDLQEYIRRRSVIKMEGFPLKGGGWYVFCVKLQEGEKWKEVAKVPVDVKVQSIDSEFQETKDTE